jgi:hypothetical protein
VIRGPVESLQRSFIASSPDKQATMSALAHGVRVIATSSAEATPIMQTTTFSWGTARWMAMPRALGQPKSGVTRRPEERQGVPPPSTKRAAESREHTGSQRAGGGRERRRRHVSNSQGDGLWGPTRAQRRVSRYDGHTTDVALEAAPNCVLLSEALCFL